MMLIDVVIPIYTLIEYSDNSSKTSVILWQYSRAEPALDVNDVITDFNVANAITDSFKTKEKITDKTSSNGAKKVGIMVPLKYLSSLNAFNQL